MHLGHVRSLFPVGTAETLKKSMSGDGEDEA
jgi:hypothetical protein